MAIIQVWSAPSCQSGAICFGALAPWVSASGSEATGTPAGFRVTVTRDVADRTSLAEGRCLRVISQSRGEQWWFVSSVSDSDGDAGLVQVTAGPLRQLLTVRGLVRDGSTFAFAPGRVSVPSLLSTYVLTNLADDALSWLSLGTVDFVDSVEIGSLDRVTRAAVLDAIERQTGHTAVLRAVFAAGVLTGFAVDVLADVAAGLDTVPLSVGADLTTMQRTRDALRAATVVVPFSADNAPMDQTLWLVDSTSGTAPAWIVLRDPLTGNPWPVQEDDQFVGAYLQQRDGTQSQILDSRASDSAVQIASVGSLVAGTEVTFVRNTAGAPVLEITSPAAVAGSRGRLVGTVATQVSDRRRNYIQNPVLATWTSTTAATGYTVGAGSIGQYPRASATGTVSLQIDGTVSTGATSIPVRGGTAGALLYRREALTITGIAGTLNINTDVVQFDGTGKATIPLATSLSTGLSDGTAVSVLLSTAGTTGPDRPASFPFEAAGDVLRLLQAATEVTTAGALVRVPSGVETINAAAGITVRTAADAGFLTSTYFPSLLLRNTGAGTTLATTASGTQVSSSTAHYTLTASATLGADTTVAARIVAGSNASPATTFLQWQGVRWLSLWVGSGETMDLQIGSGSNALWHRAQDVLASAAQGTRYVVRGVDLARLRQETGALALGQSVRLRSELLGVDATVKIVKLDYDFSATESLNLELGAITPRLTGVTVSL